jgi:hypothetical protein
MKMRKKMLLRMSSRSSGDLKNQESITDALIPVGEYLRYVLGRGLARGSG